LISLTAVGFAAGGWLAVYQDYAAKAFSVAELQKQIEAAINTVAY
jgi:hypothetical protein